jgi:hypothetical protein
MLPFLIVNCDDLEKERDVSTALPHRTAGNVLAIGAKSCVWLAPPLSMHQSVLPLVFFEIL